ncbi:MAG: M64 family metallopeptidase [Pseudomonadota bacterium]
MRKATHLLAAVLIAAVWVTAGSGEETDAEAPGTVVYAEWFTDRAMRVDLQHTATADSETVGLDEIAMEPLWAGTRLYLVDPFGYGKYRFEVRDGATGRLIFSHGFCTLLGEYQSTEEAQGIARTMSESLRFPYPRKPVTVRLHSRDRQGRLHEIFKIDIDPASLQVNKEKYHADLHVFDLHVGGKPENQVDLLILPDGYDKDEAEKMARDAARFARVFFDYEPFAGHRDHVSIRMIAAFSAQSGPDEPRKSIYNDTAFGTSFNTFGAERYLTTADNKTMRRAAALAPCDVIVIMVNTARYGGGGIYNSWSIFAADNEYDEYVYIHEFGHAFAGLADEYFVSGGAYDEDAFYPSGVEPWEPNISAFLGGKKESVKWHEMIGEGAVLPTPSEDKYGNAVGVFEGGGYKSKGLFRGYLDCKMFHKGLVPFCPVCARSIERMIDYYTGGLEGK